MQSAAPATQLLDERHLVSAARHDPAAFARLYQQFLGPVHAFARRRTGSGAVADAVTSATFERAYQDLERAGSASGGFGPWLFAIASDELVSQAKGARDRDPRVGPQPWRALYAALDRLSPLDQTTLSLGYLAGLSSSEAAAALQCSTRALAVGRSRARRALRAAFETPSTSHSGGEEGKPEGSEEAAPGLAGVTPAGLPPGGSAGDADPVELLEWLGREVMAPPGAAFADALLVRLVTNRPSPMETGPRVPAGEPTRSPTRVEARRGRSGLRLAVGAGLAVVALLVLVPPTLELVQTDGAVAELATVTLSGPTRPSVEVRIGPSGSVLGRSGASLGELVADGPATLTCSRALSFADREGRAYRCEAGESVPIRLEDATVAWSAAMPDQSAAVAPLHLERLSQEPPWVWRWSAPTGAPMDGFVAYELVRGGDGGEPALADRSGVEVVARIVDPTRTAFAEKERHDREATYQVRVLGPDGQVLALSNPVQAPAVTGR